MLRLHRPALLVGAARVLLAACSDSDDTDGSASASSETAAAGSSDSTPTAPSTTTANTTTTEAGRVPTRTFNAWNGEVEVPVDPQRIVTLSDQNALLPLLELGVEPVGSYGRIVGGQETFRRTADFDTTDVEFIGVDAEVSVEAVALLEPDLIVGGPFVGVELDEQLSEVAPVVRIDPFDQPLADALDQWAALVGREDRATELRADYEAAVAATRAALPDPQEITLIIAASGTPGTWYYESGQATGQVIADLGVAQPGEFVPRSESEPSEEVFPEHVADYVIVYAYGDEGAEAFTSSPIFRAHPAVAADQWSTFDGSDFVGSGWTKMTALAEALEPVLSDAALDLTIDVP